MYMDAPQIVSPKNDSIAKKPKKSPQRVLVFREDADPTQMRIVQ
jgi:hypothetical protein